MKMDAKARKIFRKLPLKIKNYFLEIAKECGEYGITFRVSGGKRINFGGGRCGGYFCESTKQLVIAIGRPIPIMLGTLIHEESHFDQWKDLDSIWYKPQMESSANRFFNWLSGASENKNPEKDAKKIIELEADCERRTIKKIKKRWSELISTEDYVRSANAYMFSYLWMARSRKWIGDFASKQKYVNQFPSKMKKKYEKLPLKFLSLFEEHSK
jgi:hypothetical protein